MNTESISKVISPQKYFLELMGQHKKQFRTSKSAIPINTIRINETG